MPPKHIDFGFRVARIARRLRQAVDAELRTFGLTEATWRPLAYVGRLGGGVPSHQPLVGRLAVDGLLVATVNGRSVDDLLPELGVDRTDLAGGGQHEGTLHDAGHAFFRGHQIPQ